MRRFILTVLAPVGDMMATATTLLVINGFAWVIAAVCLLPASSVVAGLAFVYTLIGFAVGLLCIGYLVLLVALALIYRVPLRPIFVNPDRRAELLQEATA